MKILNKQNHKNFNRDVTIASIIILLPFLFFTYNLAPKNGHSWDLWVFTIQTGNIWEVDIFLWNIFVKIFTILIISIWFVTSKHWWRYALFVALTMEIDKLMWVLNEEFNYVMDFKIFQIFPIVFLYAWFLIYISKKLNYYSSSKNFNHQLNEEINELTNELSNFSIQEYKTIKKQLADLRKEKETMERKLYLTKLIKIREQMDNL